MRHEDAVFKRLRRRRSLRPVLGGACLGLIVASSAFWIAGARAARVRPAGLDAAGRPEAVAPLPELAQRHAAAISLSRPLLLGSRDPALGSCVEVVRAGQVSDAVPQSKGDLDGGPGTTLAVLLSFDRQNVASARDDLHWHQTRLVTYLQSQRQLNAVALSKAEAFATAAAEFATRLAAATTIAPGDAGDRAFRAEQDWPGQCLARLDLAVRAGDVAGARRWSQELASASLHLADLHRWLGLLADTTLAALRFQAFCPEAFAACDQSGGPFAMLSSPSNLPAGMLTLHGLDNFLEVERQAEELFGDSPRRTVELETDRHLSAASIRVPPERRPAFEALAAALGPANRAVFATAAATPYEASFLQNVLFRAEAAGVLDDCAEVLRRADRRMPEATVEALMDVLVYRGHSFAGIEWADRFTGTTLTDATALTSLADADAFLAAGRAARRVFEQRAEYAATLTLRDALERGVLDCVRASDLVVTLYRNAGHAGAGHVRWSAGTAAHALPARWDAAGVFTLDPLSAEIVATPWPENCAGGCRWPALLADNPQPYAAEWFVRGIDSYVWAAGYVVRGSQAGRLERAAVPYLTLPHVIAE